VQGWIDGVNTYLFEAPESAIFSVELQTFIQSTATRRFLDATGRIWTQRSNATGFKYYVEALGVCLRFGLNNVQLVVRMSGSKSDHIIPFH